MLELGSDGDYGAQKIGALSCTSGGGDENQPCSKSDYCDSLRVSTVSLVWGLFLLKPLLAEGLNQTPLGRFLRSGSDQWLQVDIWNPLTSSSKCRRLGFYD